MQRVSRIVLMSADLAAWNEFMVFADGLRERGWLDHML